MKETKIRSKNVYHSDFLTIVEDQVALDNGNHAQRIVVRHSGASAMLPITPSGNIILVKQYRYPINQVTLEVPAGKLDEGEDPLLCALRECEEEAHVRPRKTSHVYSIHNCLGYSDEVIHLYIGYDAVTVKNPKEKDPDESFEIVTYTKKEAQALLKNKQISDVKTIVLLQHYFALD